MKVSFHFRIEWKFQSIVLLYRWFYGFVLNCAKEKAASNIELHVSFTTE